MRRAANDLGKWKFFPALPAACLLLSLILAALLTPPGAELIPVLLLICLVLASALVWTTFVWWPIWKKVSQLTKHAVPRILVMSGAGGALGIPFALYELIIDRAPPVFAIFIGIFGAAVGLTGSSMFLAASALLPNSSTSETRPPRK